MTRHFDEPREGVRRRGRGAGGRGAPHARCRSLRRLSALLALLVLPIFAGVDPAAQDVDSAVGGAELAEA
jgi:hypothetical protein